MTSDTIIQGTATSLRAPPEPADCEYQSRGGAPLRARKQTAIKHLSLLSPALTEACRQYGRETLAYLSSLEEEGAMEKADTTAIANCLGKIKTIGEVSDVTCFLLCGCLTKGLM